MKIVAILIAVALLGQVSNAGVAKPWTDRLVWIFGFDLAKPADVAEIESILRRGAAHGLNGVVLSAGLDWLIDRPAEYNRGLDRVVKICRANQLELVPSAFSFGYGGAFLGRNRNLAEGLPVKNALFIAGNDGYARLKPDPDVAIANGGFENREGNRFTGYDFHDAPGEISFADTKVFRSGKCSIRFENLASDKWGHGRVSQAIKVHPYRSYRISLWVKTQGLKPQDGFRMIALAPVEGERDLLIRNFDVPETTDWRRVTAVFNSREFDSVKLYCGAWQGKEGKFWLDDWEIEEIGPQHVLRRPGTPISVKEEDGGEFTEGRDFARLEDPDMNLGQVDSPAPDLKLLAGSRINPGTRLRVSWYHPVIVYHSQVGVCMAEPEIYEIAERGAKVLVERLKPNRVLLNMDEIRAAGTCAACRGQDMAKLLGESVSRIAGILRKESPDLEIYVWSDMFDPNHNARANYYHVKGDYTGSWKYLSKDLIIAIWGGEIDEKSFDFFTREGYQIMGACYYDAQDLKEVKDWIRVGRSYPKVRGFMYTTWERKYDLLPAFCDLLR
jgi:hypothetical protein